MLTIDNMRLRICQIAVVQHVDKLQILTYADYNSMERGNIMAREFFLNRCNSGGKCCFRSNMKCKVCGGWRGDFGDARGVGSMCSSCYYKKYGTYE